ncbi:MAG: hypothetical protein KIS78_34775 [Labilithrix sp.]|nr:hypothetical protein [Labilithrix sp.]
MTMPADRERDRRSLQDLAKMAHGLTPPPSSIAPVPSVQRAVESAQSSADDSGIVDLAAASTADPGAAVRAQSTPLASQGLFDEEPLSQRAAPLSQAPVTAPLGAQAHAQPAPSLPPLAPSLPPPSLAPQQALTPSAPPAAFAPATAQAYPQPKKKGGAVIALVLGGVVALSAAAAGGLLFLRSRANVESAPAAAVATTEPAIVAQADPAPATPAEATPAEETTPDPVEAAEPAAEVTPTPMTAPRGKGAMTPKIAAKSAKSEPPPPAAKAEGPAKMTEKDLGAVAGGPAGDLGAAMKKEVGDDAPKTPAAATTGVSAPVGNVPQKPSQGAVTGALGAVLPGARACLGPDDPISRASVVFSSNGTVQSVNVSGSAAGKPAEACIKSALTKAKVQPFAEPSYTANITVRHN